jgi:hypothetical protein
MGFESERQRNYNTLERSRGHCFTLFFDVMQRKRHGIHGLDLAEYFFVRSASP